MRTNSIDIYKLKSKTKQRVFIKASWAMKFQGLFGPSWIRPRWTTILPQGDITPKESRLRKAKIGAWTLAYSK